MKKWISLFAAFTLALALLAGCSSQEEAPEGSQEETPSDTLDLEALAGQLQEEVTFRDSLNRLDDALMANYYPTLDLSQVEEYVVYVSASGAPAEEIAFFRVKDAAAASAVEEALDKRVEDQTISFEDYRPDEMVKINNFVVVSGGNYVLAAAADDYEAAETFLSQQLQ